MSSKETICYKPTPVHTRAGVLVMCPETRDACSAVDQQFDGLPCPLKQRINKSFLSLNNLFIQLNK